jgi:RNA polymerase sigma factor (sigma-70 family)
MNNRRGRTPNLTPLTDEQKAMAAKNVRLAWDVYKKYKPGRPMGSDERLSACFLGLILAAREFKPELGYKFSSYAFKCMRSTVDRISHGESLVHVPDHLFNAKNRAKLLEKGRKPERYRRMIEQAFRAMGTAEDAHSWGHHRDRPDPRSDHEAAVDEADELASQRGRAMAAIDHLMPRHRQVMTMVFGGMSDREIAQKLGLGHSSIKTYRLDGIRQLRNLVRQEPDREIAC